MSRPRRNAAAPPTSASPPTPTPAAIQATTDSLGRSLELLSQVRAGVLTGKLLAPADRQSVVSLLSADGLSSPEIAQILQVADRTVERDRRAIRDAHALSRDPKMVEQMVGRLVAEAELSVQRIRRTTREREVDPAVKVDAEHRCFTIVRDLVQSLQKLGYLPSAAHKVEADLTHHLGEAIPSLADLQSEIDRIKLISGGAGLEEAENAVTRAAIATSVRDIVATVTAADTVAESAHED
jgi:hypothetical protein